jgi:hypothetical protein
MPLATHSHRHSDPIEATPGVPRPHKLGASRNEALALLAAVIVLAIIFVGFWFESTH